VKTSARCVFPFPLRGKSLSILPGREMAMRLTRLWKTLGHSGSALLPAVKQLWAVANSPLIIALVSGLLIAEIARSYSRRDAAAKDFEERSVRLDAALTELQQRLAYLESADRTWNERCNYPASSKAQWDALTGSGDYMPTSPSYKGVSITLVLTEAQRSSGAWDPNLDAARWFGAFSVRPPRTALFVRTHLPWLQTYVSRRTMASSMGRLPLRRGEVMNQELRQILGIPTLAEAQRESDKSHTELQRRLSAPGPDLPPCKEY